MPESKVLDLAILGTGPGGLSAAIYAGVYKLDFAVIGKDYGMLANSHEIINWPGTKSAPGLEIVQKIREHAVEVFGAKIVDDEIVSVKKLDGNYSLQTKNGKKLEAKALIVATGLMNRKLGIGEEKFIGKGVSYCATCDASFFKGKVIGVIGGNDSAAQAALLSAEYAKKVYVFYRREALRCQPIYLPKLEAKKNIEIVLNSNVTAVKGDKKLESIELGIKGKKSEMKIDGLFPEIGAVPQNILLQELGVKFDEAGFIIVDSLQKTSVEGVYAAGDITATHSGFKQAVVAAAEGAVAANSVFKFLKEKR